MKVKLFFSFLRYLPYTLFFNFRLLPLCQAVKLPIWLYKPKFGKLTGKVSIESSVIKTGMIRLGFFSVNIYPNTGCMIDIRGEVIYKGKCFIGNNSFISVGETGSLVFGNNFRNTSSIKIACYHSIVFSSDVLVGWDCLFMDTDFHALTKNDGSLTRGYAPIMIENGVWLGFGCKVFKGALVPSQCVVSAQTILKCRVDAPPKSIIECSYPVQIKPVHIFRDLNNDKIVYS